jgi:hypothetical protein
MKKAMLFFLLAAGSGTALAQPNYCMPETVVGTYAVAAQGTMLITGPDGTLLPVPAATLGVAAIDGAGAITSRSYSSMGGQISQSEMPGAIRVNSDCTATVDWGQGVTGTLVIMDEGKVMTSLMVTTGAMGNAVIYGDWKRISRVPYTVVPAQCGPNIFSGVYAVKMSGTIMVAQSGSPTAMPAPTVLLGLGSTNPGGGATAKATASVAGQMMSMDISAAEIPKVESDCTVLVTWNHSSQGVALGQSRQFIVVLDGGNEAWGLPIENFRGQPIQLATWTRLSPIPTDNSGGSR